MFVEQPLAKPMGLLKRDNTHYLGLALRSIPPGFGALTFVRGCAALLGPPLAGLALDSLGSPAAPFLLSSLLLAASAAFHGGAWLLGRRRGGGGYTPI